MPISAEKYYTPEEYTALEEKAEFKSEYYNGRIYSMWAEAAKRVDNRLNHSRMQSNVNRLLGNALAARPCDVLTSDMRVLVPANGFQGYPDTSVVCGEPELVEGRTDAYTNPSVIIEVLSPSTATYDRTTKFDLYRELDSLLVYILIDPERPYIETFERTDLGWMRQVYNDLSQSLPIVHLGISLPLADLYRRIEFAPADPHHPSTIQNPPQ